MKTLNTDNQKRKYVKHTCSYRVKRDELRELNAKLVDLSAELKQKLDAANAQIAKLEAAKSGATESRNWLLRRLGL